MIKNDEKEKEDKFRKERGDITTYATEMQEVIRDYYEQLYTIIGQSEKKA